MYRKTIYTDAEFVKAWQSSARAIDVAEKLGMTVGAVCARAYRLRRAKVKLKSMFPVRGPRRVVDVKGLNKLVAKS